MAAPTTQKEPTMHKILAARQSMAGIICRATGTPQHKSYRYS